MDGETLTRPVQRPALFTIGQHLAWHARRTPDAAAIVEAGIRVSYAALAADIVRYTGALEALPVPQGALVGIETPVRYLHLVLMVACELAGLRSVSLVASELGAGSAIAGECDLLLTSRAPGAGLPALHVSLSEAWLAETAAIAATPDDLARLDQPIPPDRVVRLMRSSGTTGAPRLVDLTHAALFPQPAQRAEWMALDVAARPSLLSIYHITFSAAYNRIFACLLLGGTVHFVTEEQAIDHIADGTVNAAMFVAGDLQRLIRAARPPPPGHRLCLMAIGAAVSPQLRAAVRERLGVDIVNYYSINETGAIARIDNDNVGTLCPGVEVRIESPQGEALPHGETGLVVVKSPTTMLRYHGLPELTASRLADGWFRTQDLGTMPAPGRLVIVGRADDMLNVGGVKIPPAPIEAELRQLDGVRDAALLSVDEPSGITALVVALEAPEAARSPALVRRVEAIIAPYLRSQVVLFLDRFPRTDTSKLRRGELAALFLRTRTAR